MPDPRFIPAPRLARFDAPARPRRMATAMTAGAAVLAMLLATTLPVRAGDRDDLAKALIAAIVIGAIIKESKKSRTAPPPVEVVKPRIPRVCAIDIQSNHRPVTIYPESCLREVGITGRLPACGTEARVYGRWDRIYSEACLVKSGFIVTSGKIY
jgi:hypothetical protein